MAELQPSLLDRLTDDEPGEQQESPEKRVLSMRQLRQCVIRDLRWLFNTSGIDCSVSLDGRILHEDLSDHPLIACSVLNYGMRDLAGLAAAGIDPVEVERSMRQAIIDFEPRIQSKTVKVRAEIAEDAMNRRALTFEIEGDLWGQPAPLHLLLKTTVDLDTGNVTVSDQSKEGSG